MRKKLLALLFPLIFLAACGPTEGVVIDKNYDPAHYTTTWMPCGGKGALCPTQQYWPDSWNLRIDPQKNDEKPGWRQVSSGVYETCPIGSRFLHTDNGDSCKI